jgi:hypothetical protein
MEIVQDSQETTEVTMEACLQKAKAGLEEMEAMVDVFEERLVKMDAMDLEAKPKKWRPQWSGKRSLMKRLQ